MTRRLLQVVAILGTLLIGVTSMAVIVSQTTWFKEWLRGVIVRRADQFLNGQLSIGRLDGNLFFGVEMEDVRLDMQDEHVVDVKDLGVNYDVFELITGDIAVHDIRINRPVIRVRRSGDTLNVLRLLKVQAPTTEPKKPGRPISIEEIGITDGRVFIDPDVVGTSGVNIPGELYKLNASVKVESDATHLGVRVNHLAMRTAGPRLAINDVSGAIRRTQDRLELRNISLRTAETSLHLTGTVRGSGDRRTFDLHATSDKTSLPEIARIVPALEGIDLQPAFELQARGPMSALDVTTEIRSQAGQVDAAVRVDAAKPGQRVSGAVTTRGLNIAPVVRSEKMTSDLTGHARFDLRLPERREPLHGTYSIDAPRVAVAGYDVRNVRASGRVDGQVVTLDSRVQAYGGRATATGTITTGKKLAFDLEGQASGVDLRNLPKQTGAPAVPSRLTFSYHVRGAMPVIDGDVTLRESTLAGATIGDGTIASFRVGGGPPSYAARGSVQALDLERIGRAFRIAALANPRFASAINGRFSMNGSGSGLRTMQLEASGQLVDSKLFGASLPQFTFTAGLGQRTLTVAALGPFLGLNPAFVSGRRDLEGQVNGVLDVRAKVRGVGSGAIPPENVDANGRINLGRSSVAGLTLDTAVVDGSFDGRTAQVTQVAVKGPDLNVQAGGIVGLGPGASSDFKYHLDTPSVERIGTLIHQPLRGGVITDGTVTGTREQLLIEGTLHGSDLARANVGALALDGRFRVAVPNLTFGAARVDSTLQARFVQIGGQKIPTLNLKSSYQNNKVSFDAVAQQQTRQLNAAGDIELHPDHQEVHVRDLALRSQQVEWRTAPGAQATVRYGKDRLIADQVRLVSGTQTIAADGALGRPGDVLKVSMANVDVGALDKLLLTNQGIAGQLNADATVSGAMGAPSVSGRFALTNGAFRQFTFQQLGGTVDYTKTAATLDLRLDEKPGQWLTAKGRIPLSEVAPTPRDHGAHEEASSQAVELQITSSKLDLGVIEGFTRQVSNVTGTVEANVRVGNTFRDPHLDGVIEIRNGSLNVPAAGETYTGIDTRIDLAQDAIRIANLRILDDDGDPLDVSGQLAVHERQLGGVTVSLKSKDFDLMDNDFGSMHVDSDLRITGEVSAPRIEGSVTPVTATIDVANVLEAVTASPYATAEVSYGSTSAKQAATTAATKEGVMGPLAMNVSVTVPGDMVLKGNDIRAGAGSIGLGDVNMTVGANVRVLKKAGDTIRLTGEIVTVRGTYDFQSRRFEVLRDGRIRFIGLDRIDPLLDVTARRLISGVEALIHIRGTMTSPEISFTSSPPLDQADILSLIVFNQPINQLGEGQQVSLAERASAMATGYLASSLTQSLGKALNLDIFEISAGTAEEGGPSLTVGEQVGERLFVKFRRGFGADTANEFLLEYRLADFLRLQSSISDVTSVTRSMFRRQERGGIDLVWFFSY